MVIGECPHFDVDFIGDPRECSTPLPFVGVPDDLASLGSISMLIGDSTFEGISVGSDDVFLPSVEVEESPCPPDYMNHYTVDLERSSRSELPSPVYGSPTRFEDSVKSQEAEESELQIVVPEGPFINIGHIPRQSLYCAVEDYVGFNVFIDKNDELVYTHRIPYYCKRFNPY